MVVAAEMSSSLLPAIFGLVGVIVGGLLTATSNYVLDAVKDKRQQQREARVRELQARAAVRLVYNDVDRALAFGETMVEKKTWWRSLSPLTADAWLKYRADLATELASKDWERVSNAVEIIETWNTRRNSDMAQGVRSIDENILSTVPEMIEELKGTSDALKKYLNRDSASKFVTKGRIRGYFCPAF